MPTSLEPTLAAPDRESKQPERDSFVAHRPRARSPASRLRRFAAGTDHALIGAHAFSARSPLFTRCSLGCSSPPADERRQTKATATTARTFDCGAILDSPPPLSRSYMQTRPPPSATRPSPSSTGPTAAPWRRSMGCRTRVPSRPTSAARALQRTTALRPALTPWLASPRASPAPMACASRRPAYAPAVLSVMSGVGGCAAAVPASHTTVTLHPLADGATDGA